MTLGACEKKYEVAARVSGVSLDVRLVTGLLGCMGHVLQQGP